MEEWRSVVGFEGFYEVSSFGRVRSMDRISHQGHRLKSRVLKPGPARGYLLVVFCMESVTYAKTVHSVVMRAFVGERPLKAHINHKDGNKHNNAVSNLEYTTASENAVHAFENDLRHGGERHPKTTLTEQHVREIRQMRGSVGIAELGERFGVSVGTISAIQTGKTWKKTSAELIAVAAVKGSGNGRAKLTESDIRVIRTSDEAGTVLALRYGVGKSTISRIRLGKNWTHI